MEWMKAAKKDALKTPVQETVDSEKILNKFTHVLHRIDNNILAKALHYCKHFDYTCCLQFMNTFTAHKMSGVILKFILHLDENGFTNVCMHLTDHPEDITELYYAYQRYCSTGSSYFASHILEKNDYYIYLKHKGHSFIRVEFFKLVEHLQSVIGDPKVLLNYYQKVMASKTCNIPYFSEEDMKGFYSCKNHKVLFRTWNCFWTWSDHSMLREFLVLGGHTDVLKLIDAFDDYLDTLKSQPIATFILPHLSNKMIPSDTNIHTILAIKHKKSFEKCTLQNIFEIRQALLKNCDITPHALQLLTVTDDDSEYTTVFWIIPKCIVPLFNTKVADQWENFNKDIAEISIYPNSLFTMSSTIKVGPLALLTSTPTESDELLDAAESTSSNLAISAQPTPSPRDDLCVIEGKEELSIQKAPSKEDERESDGKNEAQDSYEGKIHAEMKEMQLLHKVEMETLNEELSDIKSQVMTKTLQYQKVVEEKRRLVQKIRSLQSATSSSVKMSQMAVQNTKLVADSEVQDLKNHYNLTVEKEKLEMLQGFSKDEKIQHVEKISTQHKRILCKIRDLRTVSYAGKARIFSRKSCMSKECYEQKSVYYAKKISASSLKSSKNKSASNATKRPSRSIARSNTILGCATKSAHTSAVYAYMSTFSAVLCEKISVFSASNVLKRLQGSDNMQQGQQQQDRKSSGDLTTSTESVKSQEPLEYQQRDEEKNMEQFISILHCH